jgi:O-6-methylguanine DNA methyltransferase
LGGSEIASRLIESRFYGDVTVSVRYEVDGWGVGELWLAGETLLWHELPGVPATGPDPRARRHNGLADRLRQYFDGARDSFADVAIDIEDATPFQRAVVAALRRVPFGEVVSYGELAALAGYPNAQRAAGSVCAHNHWPIVVPCHRVVAANGIGGYGPSGVAVKRRLLEHEGVFL